MSVLKNHRRSATMRAVGLVTAVALIAIIGSGCSASTETDEETTSQSETEVVQEPVYVAPEPVVQDSTTATWNYERADGYTCSVMLTAWEPVPADITSAYQHPEETEFTVDPAVDFDPTRDVAIPVQVLIRNTTSGFELQDAMTMVQVVGLPVEGAGVSGMTSKEMEWICAFSNARETHDWVAIPSPDGDAVSVSYANFNDGPIMVTWAAMSPNAAGSVNMFAIVRDYFTPAAPEGSLALLDGIGFQPMQSGWEETGEGNPQHMTLSRHIVTASQ